MYKTKLCLGTMKSLDLSVTEQIRLFKNAVFEAFLTTRDKNLRGYRELADELNMIYQSVHAPFADAARDKNVNVAFENVEGDEYLEALMDAFRDYDNDKYAKLSDEEYIAECYVSACRIAYMRKYV